MKVYKKAFKFYNFYSLTLTNRAICGVWGEPVPAPALEGSRQVCAHLLAIVLTVRALVHINAHRVVVDEETGGAGARETSNRVAALTVLRVSGRDEKK